MGARTELKKSAKWYAEKLHWRVFPVHSIRDGRCTCGADCQHPGKHPRTPHGFKDATTDLKQIEEWWRAWPDANIGLATGEVSGVDVLDVDPRACGAESLWELEQRHGEMPSTVTSLTGGGGAHIFFQHSAGLKNQASEIGAGLDFKTTGGYVILPPSNHASGRSYVWEGAGRPNETKVAQIPNWLLQLVQTASTANGNGAKPATPITDKIPSGQRNSMLASLAGSMRRREMVAGEIAGALMLVNNRRCDPPLPDGEVRAIAESVARYEPSAVLQQSAKREFSSIGDNRYRLDLPELGITFDLDRLRREHSELIGELCVRCLLPGAQTVNDGALSIGDLNISSVTARKTRANLLSERSKVPELDWHGLVEEFSQKVLEADRAGQPAIDLRELAISDQDNVTIEVDGLALPSRHPAILFGDGGSAKSYLGLYIAGRLAERGMRVALFDWELCGEDHRIRLGRLFPDGMPQIFYVRSERPLFYETDRLRRIVLEKKIEYTIFDSIAFACDGPPEAAEVAGRYFRALRQLGAAGSLHIAHVNRSDNGDKKPFGSTFWHNGARSTWFIEKSDESADGGILNVGLFNRKANLGRLRPSLGFAIVFSDHQTIIRRAQVSDSPDLAKRLTVKERMYSLLRKGPMTPEAIAEEIEANVETVKRKARDYKNLFTVIEGGRYALLRSGA